MTGPSIEAVQAYYDSRITGKIRDFTHANPRIEAAVRGLAEWAPVRPRRILEIGCGIGATSWRMARAWPDAEVIGADVSSASIDVATTCFRRDNLRFCQGIVAEGTLSGNFDFVVLMDVYEHIALGDRASLHSAIRSLLGEDARIFISVPTPVLQAYGRQEHAAEMQPIDEDVTPSDLIRLAEETATHLLYYREMGIWRYGDYAHVALGRYRQLAEVALRAHRATGIPAIKQALKRLLREAHTQQPKQSDYLGSDVLRASRRRIERRFEVSSRRRQSLVSAWFHRHRS